ncbi:MAG TPA: hypothetical protein VG389_01440 [Myxococcota bacterium]|jgi:hypothetical protein|nr:hypothetical protein [Myxococcota bacterium]
MACNGASRAAAALLGAALVAVAAAGCEGSAASAFTVGLREDRCVDNFFICTTAGGCRLEPTNTPDAEFLSGRFPEARRFIVRTDGPAVIRVRLLLTNLEAAGTETQITWFEPGCTFSYEYNTNGADLFTLAGDDQLFEQERMVQQGGDHLLEFFSDAVCDYYLKVDVEEMK